MEKILYDTVALNQNTKLPVLVRFAGWQDCPPSFDHGPCRRDHYIIHFIIKGKGIYQTKNEIYQVESGSAFLIHPYEFAYYKADAEEPWEYYWIAWSGEYAEYILNDINFEKAQYIFKFGDANKLIRYFRSIFDIYEKTYNIYNILGEFYSILSLFAGNASRENPILTEALAYIHKNFGEIRSVTEIANHVFLSRSQLYRIFEENLNKSPKQYLIDYRILRAQDLLESRKISIEDISVKCGFNSTTHFSNTFKNKTGLSPIKYQKFRDNNFCFFFFNT